MKNIIFAAVSLIIALAVAKIVYDHRNAFIKSSDTPLPLLIPALQRR